MSFLFGSNKENKTFTRQQGQAFQQINQQSQLYNDFVQDTRDMMWARFGQQTRVMGYLEDYLAATASYGPGQLNPNANDFFREEGFLPGEGGGGGGQGGPNLGSGSFQERVEAARRARESGTNPLDWTPMSGYNPDMFNVPFTPRRFYASEGAALRSQMTEQATDSYGDAAQAFGQRALQMGGYGAGAEAAALRDLEDKKAAAQMEGQRQAILFGAQNMRDDVRAFAPLRTQLAIANADALAREAGMQNQIMASKASQAMAARESAANRRAAAAQARAAQQQWSAAQRQRAAEFGAEMKLKGAQFNSENFFRAIGAMSGLAGMQDPQGYMSGILGGLGGPMNAYGNIYNTGSQGMIQTRQQPMWGQLLGAGIGGVLGNWGSIFGGGGGYAGAMSSPLGGSRWSDYIPLSGQGTWGMIPRSIPGTPYP